MTTEYKNPLRDFCKLGKSFNYLGITMVTVAFYEAATGGYALAYPHRMVAEYADGNGQVLEKIFYEHHLNALYAQNTTKHLMS